MKETLILFIVITLLNIIISTIKSVLIINCSPITAGALSALNYTVNAVAVLLTAQQTTLTVIIVAFIANLVGVTITKIVMDKIAPERLWIYNCTIKTTKDNMESFRETMKNKYGIHCTWETVVENQIYAAKFFVETKEQSSILKDKLKLYNTKYYIIQPR